MPFTIEQLRPNVVVRGPLFPEPVQVIVATPIGAGIRLVGKGLTTSQVYEPILNGDQLATLEISTGAEPYDGDPAHFRLGIEALRIALAFEYDPYFSLSIARVDPLPHQLEAVYDFFLKLARIRFLLADDPGAGKTIMAGLLLKELKIRGLVKRTLIVTPANLSFQWQREMKESSVRASRSSGVTCCDRPTAAIHGRRRAKPSHPFPGCRESRTPSRACCGATGI